MVKSEIRKLIKSKRECLDKDEKKVLDKKIAESFLNSKCFKECNLIFIYVNMDSEIDTISIIEKSLAMGKRVAVPKVYPIDKDMKAIEIKSLLDLNESGAFGILEPGSNDDVSDEIDLVVLPGLAFDESGNRIGYGGGFYDKFLEKNNNILKITLCYNFQVLRDIPKEEFDQKVDSIITEDRIIKIT